MRQANSTVCANNRPVALYKSCNNNNNSSQHRSKFI